MYQFVAVAVAIQVGLFILKNIGRMLGLVVVVIIGSFIYLLVTSDFNVEFALTEVMSSIKGVFDWIVGFVTKYGGKVKNLIFPGE